MAVDPNKLAAFANQPPKGGKPPGGPPPGGGGGAPPKEAAEKEEGGPEEGGDDAFSALLPLLEASVEDLEANCDELDMDMLKDASMELADEDKQILVESFDLLPDELKAEMVKVLGGIDIDDAQKIADHLAEEDMITDAPRTAGYLVRVGALVDSGDLKAGEAADDSEDEEGEESPDEDE